MLPTPPVVLPRALPGGFPSASSPPLPHQQTLPPPLPLALDAAVVGPVTNGGLGLDAEDRRRDLLG
jgi:hypothetical protein